MIKVKHNTDILQRISENNMPYLKEIAEKLKQGKAAVMVGSGFSKNATPYRHTDKHFLDWNQLGDIFYEKLNGKYPQDEDSPNYYLDVLKLASLVEQCFGRTTLDGLLIENLPDEEYEPSELHEMLLKLNWNDIFTTNYDTLLERTRIKVFDRNYQLVLNRYDLVYSKRPRIIKLHGSFPSTRPFILTEEDYRRYPKDFAVFVNTVQQSLIENIMCMIGFSGNDPNFLNWIGWIRDNLGNDAASKIYLVGVFDLNPTEIKLYESRNIVLINMKDCDGIETGQHKEGLKLFIQALTELQSAEKMPEKSYEKENIDCVLMDSILCNIARLKKAEITESEQELSKKLKEICIGWELKRKYYSGWIIMPYSQREQLEPSVNQGMLLLVALNEHNKIIPRIGEFLYEFNWRRERCLIPMNSQLAEVYEIYLLELKNHYAKQNKNCIISQYDMSLYLALLEFFRERGDFEHWEKYTAALLEYSLNEEQKMQLYVEQAYKLFYAFNFRELSEHLMSWSDGIRDAETTLPRAALLCELGYYDKAIWLLKLCLNIVREQTGKDFDYQNYSKEAYIIVLLENIEKYDNFISSDFSYRNNTEYHTRLRSLWRYDCNPEYERDYLISKTSYMYTPEAKNTQNILYIENQTVKLIKFMEQTGSIFRNSYLFHYKRTYPKLVTEIVKTNAYLALICTLRFDDIIACREIWCEETLAYLDETQVDLIIKTCIDACTNNKNYILETLGYNMQEDRKLKKREDTHKTRTKSIATVLPRLCPTIIAGVIAKSSSNIKNEVIKFLSFALNHLELEFDSINLMTNALLNSMSGEELNQYAEEFFKIPIECKVQYTDNEVVLEPFNCFDFSKALIYRRHARDIFEDIDSRCKNVLESQATFTNSHYVYIRILAYSILTGNACYGEKAAKTAKKLYKKDNTEPLLCKLYDYYQITFKADSEIASIKEAWVQRLSIEVNEFINEGSDYCDTFRNRLKELLLQLKFYRCNSSDLILWSNHEIATVISLLIEWTIQVKDCKTYQCIKELRYTESWYILFEILLELLFYSEKTKENTFKQSLQELASRLHQINLSFVTMNIFINEIPVFSQEVYDELLFALVNDEKSFVEVAKLTGFYLLTQKENLKLIEQLWEMILQIGEKHASVEMVYLYPLVEEVRMKAFEDVRH